MKILVEIMRFSRFRQNYYIIIIIITIIIIIMYRYQEFCGWWL